MVQYWLRMLKYWPPDGVVLALGWCSTGLRMGQFLSGNAAGKVWDSLVRKKHKRLVVWTKLKLLRSFHFLKEAETSTSVSVSVILVSSRKSANDIISVFLPISSILQIEVEDLL